MYHRSYKNFDDSEFIHDISDALFHVGEVFNDTDVLPWLTSGDPFQYPVRRLIVRSRKSRSREIVSLNCRITLKFDMLLSNSKAIGQFAIHVQISQLRDESLLTDIINDHAPVKSKILKRVSIPYMNLQLRKVIYRRNMVWNEFRKYGSTYWEDNRIHRNWIVATRKTLIPKYFFPEMLFVW